MQESTYTTPRGGLTHDAKIELLDSRFAGLEEPEPEPSLGRVTDDAHEFLGARHVHEVRRLVARLREDRPHPCLLYEPTRG